MAKDTYYLPNIFEKNLAINTNVHHLQKMCSEYGLVKSDLEILRIAKWNYKNFGFGKVSLRSYYESKGGQRLYNIDVKLWYRLLHTIFERDNYTCTYCGAIGGKLEGDHVIPISKGGSNELDNLTTSCRKCNRQKKDKSVDEFLNWKNNG